MTIETRERDEEILKWIEMIRDGWTIEELANLTNHPRVLIETSVNDVRDADVSESGEKTKGAYW